MVPCWEYQPSFSYLQERKLGTILLFTARSAIQKLPSLWICRVLCGICCANHSLSYVRLLSYSWNFRVNKLGVNKYISQISCGNIFIIDHKWLWLTKRSWIFLLQQKWHPAVLWHWLSDISCRFGGSQLVVHCLP